MEKQFVIPRFPTVATVLLCLVALVEILSYGFVQRVTYLWPLVILGIFYLGYSSLIRKDVLPLIFSILFFTAFHSLFLNIYSHELPIALVFGIIFVVNSVIMWFLLHYATHLKPDHHLAYSIIAGFLIAQISTLFAAMERDWPFQLELAAYMPTLFSYIFWRFACLYADSVLGWKQFLRMAALVIILIVLMIIGLPNSQV